VRLLSRTLVAGLSLAILAAAVLLVPAHLQVRGVAPALPDTAALRALLNEVDAPVLIHVMETALGADPAVSHGTIAELLGDRIQRVEGIGFTHLHIDHTIVSHDLASAEASGLPLQPL
jgi:hypothetical protein